MNPHQPPKPTRPPANAVGRGHSCPPSATRRTRAANERTHIGNNCTHVCCAAKANRPQILLRHPLHQPLLTTATISNFKHGKYLAVHRILSTIGIVASESQPIS